MAVSSMATTQPNLRAIDKRHVPPGTPEFPAPCLQVCDFWCRCEQEQLAGAVNFSERSLAKCRETADSSLWHVETLLCREQFVQEAYNTFCVRCEHAAEAFMHNEAASCQWSICRAESCLNITNSSQSLIQICDGMRDATFKIGTFCPCDRMQQCNCVCSTWAQRSASLCSNRNTQQTD